MKRSIKTFLALAFFYLVYLVVKFFFLRKIFAVSGKKSADAKGAAKGQKGVTPCKVQNSARHVAKDAEETALDPVCGNYVPISSAVSLVVSRLPSHVLSGGETVFFCSGACRDAFTAAAGRHGT